MQQNVSPIMVLNYSINFAPKKKSNFVPQKRRAGRVKSVTLPSPISAPCALLTNGGALTVVGFIRRGGATGKKVGVTVTAGASRNSALSSLEQEG